MRIIYVNNLNLLKENLSGMILHITRQKLEISLHLFTKLVVMILWNFSRLLVYRRRLIVLIIGILNIIVIVIFYIFLLLSILCLFLNTNLLLVILKPTVLWALVMVKSILIYD